MQDLYKVKVLEDNEFDNLYKKLPYMKEERLKQSLGFANPKTKEAYIRNTGVKDLNDMTILHEVMELISTVSPHELDGIRYKGKEPEYTPPPAPKLPTAEELMAQAMQFGQTNYPLTYGSREGALADLLKGTSYYEQFQPTSFEDALANQYFKNVWPGQEAQIKQALSMSGMAYSPILAEQLGTARGKLGTDIGSYLSDLGNARAQYSLGSRLGIAPEASYGTQLQTNVNQSNNQAQLDFQAAIAKSQADYQNALAKYNQQQAKYQTIGMVSPLGGAIYGGASGGSSGLMSSLTGTMDTAQMLAQLYGASQGSNPLSFQSALNMAQPSNLGTSQAGIPQAVNTSQYRMNLPSFSNLTGGY